ncbi:DUF6457 domain-containing protein, partial [Streptomyces sp. NPDC058398]|uniref:DUF6457 domain-containing protein n=1 Tax=Streptomyces sp. NPDC058398 TaxID=3346479 RepID=UPI00365C178D
GPGARPAGHATGTEGPGARPAGHATGTEGPGARPAGHATRTEGPSTGHVGHGIRTGGPGVRPDGSGFRADGPGTRHDGPGIRADGPGTRSDGVLLTDSDGRDQPLVAVYRADALRRELGVLAATHGSLSGLPLRRLVAALGLIRITDPVASFDCDTWGDIAAARARIREHGHVLDEWISAVKDELGIDLDVDTGGLLDLARDAAHGVARPAAPLTTFLVGYAAARAGGGPEAVAEAARKATALALRWADEDTPDARPDSAAPAAPVPPATPATPATEPDAG